MTGLLLRRLCNIRLIFQSKNNLSNIGFAQRRFPKIRSKFVRIHTSPRRPINPIIALLLKTKGIKVLKGVSIIFGRTFRKLHNRLPIKIQDQLSRHKVAWSFVSFTMLYVGYYSYVHYDTSPITGRRRWISFTREQILALAEINQEQLQKQYSSKLIKNDSELFTKCQNIVSTIVKSNSDMELVRDIEWKLNVVDDEEVNNAFVLPNGQIYVFTGILQLLDSWQEVAIIIGHEMSHALLGHVQEQQSFLAFGELLMIPLLSFIWFLFDDFAAFIVYSAQQLIYPLIFEVGFNLPFSRKLEMEADEVGLTLVAKSCFDPRWSVLLWDKMALKEACDDFDGENVGDLEYISTHPSHERRADLLEKQLPDAAITRISCNCPDLPSDEDPLAKAHQLRKLTKNIRKRTSIRTEISALKERLDQNSTSEARQTLAELQTQLALLEKEFAELTSQKKDLKIPEKKNILLSWIKNFQGFFKRSSFAAFDIAKDDKQTTSILGTPTFPDTKLKRG